LHSHCRYLLLLICLLGPSALVVATRTWYAAEQPNDDGWRRTADGWENSQRWPSITSAWFSQASPTRATTSGWRVDSHPAALALSQLGLVILGFYAFPAPARSAQTLSPLRWRALLVQSFRASVFG
jgi:hypothetical protein